MTTRLNFLKERRNQIASELQSIDKGRGSSTQPVLSPGKGGKVSEPIHAAHNRDKNQSPGASFSDIVDDCANQSSHSSSKGSSHSSSNKKSDSRTGSKKGSSSKSEQNEQHLDRMNSEGQSSSGNSDKGQRQDGQPSRTLSR